MRIAEKYFIDLEFYVDCDSKMAKAEADDGFNFEMSKNTNPRRAICEVFLMMDV